LAVGDIWSLPAFELWRIFCFPLTRETQVCKATSGPAERDRDLVHKVAFQLGSLTIYWYGVLVAVGFLFGLWTAGRRALRDGLFPEQVIDLGPWLVVGAILGARALYVVSYWKEDFANQPISEIFMIRHGGMVYFGGLVGAAVAGFAYVRWKKLPFWRLADVLAPSIALGHVFGRFGCLMNGCCYGYPTKLPWAIYFPKDHVMAGIGVHPTEIYEALLNLALYAALAWLFPRKKFEGQIFALYLVSYAVLRAVVEIFRGDYATYYFGGHVTPAQLVCAGVFVAGLFLLWWLPRQKHLPAAIKSDKP
jgi:phosphatidylglycerol:prolipoprotein diacylglycerol transferase